jgi:hypothetical protein
MWVRSAVGWCRYYRRNHWKYGMVRDDEHLIHNKLVDWSVVEADEEMLNSAVSSLAATLWSLHQLGYRSRLVRQPFTRVGTVAAEQRNTPWTWTSQSGQTMQANRQPMAKARKRFRSTGAAGRDDRNPGGTRDSLCGRLGRARRRR